MRKHGLTMLFLLLIIVTSVNAQLPQSFKYQAVARDSMGNQLANQNVSFRISILQESINGLPVYVETHDTITNQFGLVNLEIGKGNPVSGVFHYIYWGTGQYFIKTEMDEQGGTNYKLMGISQILSVPLSFYSETSGGLVLTDENGVSYEVGVDTLGNLITTYAWKKCGDVLIDSRDGNHYETVMIGFQCWMAENLAYLPAVYPSNQGSDSSPYYYVYDYQGTSVNGAKSTVNYQVYGVLYNWKAAMAGAIGSNSVPSGVKGVCPTGWHIPSDEEWKMLEGAADSQYGYPDAIWDDSGWRGTDAGGNLKETGTTYWNTPNAGATNNTGFSALPGGRRTSYATFQGVAEFANFWSATEDYNNVSRRNLGYQESDIFRNTYSKSYGASVRCIKD